MRLSIERDVSLAPYNTFGVDVRAACFVRVGRPEELGELLADPKWQALPRLILGGGSNLLLTRDFEGLVIRIEMPSLKGDIAAHTNSSRAGEQRNKKSVTLDLHRPEAAPVLKRLVAVVDGGYALPG